jgi:SAM-dependent methyltransferase
MKSVLASGSSTNGSKRNYKSSFYPESRFGGFTYVDSTIAFYLRVNALISPESDVLDVGSGRGAYADDPIPLRRDLRIFKGRCRKVIGIDVDPAAAENPFIDEFRLIEAERWPLDDDSMDVCVCDSVLEHVQDPERFFHQLRRVTKPGGYVCFRTPNRLSYFGVASRFVPNRLHFGVRARVQTPRATEEKDVFPTVYRCNTRRKLAAILTRYGFDNCVSGYEPEPAYLSFSRLAYAFGVLHQKVAPQSLKVVLLAFGRRGVPPVPGALDNGS